jgi:hypothetical protein
MGDDVYPVFGYSKHANHSNRVLKTCPAMQNLPVLTLFDKRGYEHAPERQQHNRISQAKGANPKMETEYQVVYEPKPVEEAWGLIGEGISNYNTQQAGDDHPRRICYVVRGPDEKIVGA